MLKGFKGISKLFLILGSVFSGLLVLSFAAAQTVTISYDEASKTYLIKALGANTTEIQLVSNTEQCIGNTCEAEIRLKVYLNITTPVDKNAQYSWSVVNRLGFSARIDAIEVYTVENVAQVISSTDCSSKTNVTTENGTLEVCSPLNTSTISTALQRVKVAASFYNFTFVAGKDYFIRLKGTAQASLLKSANDWLPTISGFALDRWAWWNTSWKSCQVISISRTVEIPSNYTHTIRLNTTNINYSEMKTDGTDIRIISGNACGSSTNTAYPYYIKSFNSSGNSTIEFRTSETNITSVLLYYNNDAAPDITNFTTAYLFGYNGTNTDVDCSSFVPSAPLLGGQGTGSCTVSGRIQLSKTAATDSAFGWSINMTKHPAINSSGEIVVNVTGAINTTSSCTSSNAQYALYYDNATSTRIQARRNANVVDFANATTTPVTVSWTINLNNLTYSVRNNGSSLLWNVTDSTKSNQSTGMNSIGATVIRNPRIAIYCQNNPIKVTLEQYVVRRFVNETPTYTFSSEQVLWDRTWARCQVINISRPLEIPVNYTHTIVLNTTNVNYSRMKTDGTDIRIVAGNDCNNPTDTLYPYYIKSFNSSGNSTVEFKTNETNVTTVLLYYQKSTALDIQDQSNTFLFYHSGVNSTCTDFVNVSENASCIATATGTKLEDTGQGTTAKWVINTSRFNVNTSDPVELSQNWSYQDVPTINVQWAIFFKDSDMRFHFYSNMEKVRTFDANSNIISENAWTKNNAQATVVFRHNLSTIFFNVTNATASVQARNETSIYTNPGAIVMFIYGGTSDPPVNVTVKDFTIKKFMNETPSYSFGAEQTPNNAPVINSVRLNTTSLGGANNLTLVVNVTDVNGNRDTCSFGSVMGRNGTGDFCVLDIPDTLAQNGTVNANDTSAANATSFAINFTLTNNTYQQNASWPHNLTLQHIQKNDTLTNNHSSNALLYNISHAVPVGGSVVSGGPFSGTLGAGQSVNFTSEFSGDWIAEVEGFQSRIQNTSATSNLTIQYVMNVTHLNATNSRPFTFSNVNLAASCENTASANIPTGTNQITTSCSNITDNQDYLIEVTGVQARFQNTSATSNLTQQFIVNQTHLNVTNSLSFQLNSVNLSPTCTNVVTGNVPSGTNQITTNCSYVNNTGDFLAETFGTEEQDSSQVSEAGANAYSRRVLNVTSSAGLPLVAVSLGTRCRQNWTQNASSADISTTGLTNYVIGCNSSAVLVKSRNRYNISDSKAVVGVNSTGFLETLALNNDTLNYIGVLVNVSTGSLIPSGWVLNDTETYLLNLTNGSSALRNSTIKTSLPLVQFLSPVATDCTGYTIYSDYCFKDATTDLGGGKTLHTTVVRHVINETSNLTPGFEVVVPMPLERFTNWASRDSGSESGLVNSSSTNISLASDGSYVNLTIGTNHTNSSVEVGQYWVDVEYTWTTQIGQSPGGGGGGGGGAQVVQQFLIIGNQSFTISPAQLGRPMKPGDEYTKDFVISCTSSTNCTVTMSIEQFESDPSYRWATLRLGNEAYSTYTFNVAPGTILSPGTAGFNLSVRVPIDTSEAAYKFFVTGTAQGAPVQHVPVMIPVGQGFCLYCSIESFIGQASALLDTTITLPQPFVFVQTFSGWQLAGAICVAIAVLWLASKAFGRKRGR